MNYAAGLVVIRFVALCCWYVSVSVRAVVSVAALSGRFRVESMQQYNTSPALRISRENAAQRRANASVMFAVLYDSSYEHSALHRHQYKFSNAALTL